MKEPLTSRPSGAMIILSIDNGGEGLTFGTRLRDLRQDHGISLRQVAEKTGIDYPLLSRIERDLRPPPEIHQVFFLMDALDIADLQVIAELLTLACGSPVRTRARDLPKELSKMVESPSLRRCTDPDTVITFRSSDGEAAEVIVIESKRPSPDD